MNDTIITYIVQYQKIIVAKKECFKNLSLMS